MNHLEAMCNNKLGELKNLTKAVDIFKSCKTNRKLVSIVPILSIGDKASKPVNI